MNNIKICAFLIHSAVLQSISAANLGLDYNTQNDQPPELNINETEARFFSEKFDPETDVVFLLFTKRDPAKSQQIKIDDPDSFHVSNFNPTDPIRILCHGFRDGPGAIINNEGRKALFQKGDYNVIVVDWSKGADTVNYIEATIRVPQVGEQIAKLTNYIVNLYAETRLNQFGFIGHSLGAHVVGFAGKNVQNGKIPFIIGCDPAGPLYSLREPHERLASTDAEIVQIIHTDGSLQGFYDPIGFSDFYPNSGKKQPGCGIDLTGGCSHMRAPFLWAESINSPTGFWASPCDFSNVEKKNCVEDANNLILMGGDPIVNRVNGTFYLTTESYSPYARGKPHKYKVFQKF